MRGSEGGDGGGGGCMCVCVCACGGFFFNELIKLYGPNFLRRVIRFGPMA